MLENGEKKFVVFLGHKLRKLRKEQNLTQLDLARQVGITNGQISTIERGVSSPSISTLHRISSVLGVSMAEFFDDQPGRDVHIVKSGTGRRVEGTDENVSVQVLVQRGGNGGVNALLVQVDAGDLQVVPKPHGPEEYFLYVLQGKCELLLEDDVYSLEKNDSAYVSARKEQWIRNTGAGPFEALLISQSALIGSEIQTLLSRVG
jgi:transcriptional regulator with XRE-family HTH domain